MSLKQLCKWFFVLGIFLIPFTNFQGMQILKEYAKESAIYPWLLGGILLFLFSLFKKKTFYFPYKYSLILIVFAFIIWSLLSYTLNIESIQDHFFKFRTGNSRFFSQLISLIISSVFLIYFFWNTIRSWSLEQVFFTIRKTITYSFIFVFLYGLLELLVINSQHDFIRKIVLAFNYLPFINKETFYFNRLSSVAFEVPSLGNYLIFVAGWMLSYIFTEKNKWLGSIPAILVLVLVVKSGARAATVIVFFQFFVFLVIYYFYFLNSKIVKKIVRIGIISAATLCVVFSADIVQKINNKLNFFTVENNISNQSRYGMQYATLQVFKEHYLIGVGLGQNTFHKRDHYPNWAIKDNFEFSKWYLNENVPDFPPDFNIYTRLLAELGIIGCAIFIFFQVECLRQTRRLLRLETGISRILAITLFISFVGFAINWLQIDFFRQFGFWLCFTILLFMNKNFFLIKSSNQDEH